MALLIPEHCPTLVSQSASLTWHANRLLYPKGRYLPWFNRCVTVCPMYFLPSRVLTISYILSKHLVFAVQDLVQVVFHLNCCVRFFLKFGEMNAFHYVVIWEAGMLPVEDYTVFLQGDLYILVSSHMLVTRLKRYLSPSNV